MADTFREVSVQGWLGRIGGSLIGVLIGLVAVAGAFYLLFWNEGRAVDRARTLSQGEAAVVAVASDKVDSANEGKLVHLTGKAVTEETMRDDAFGISAVAIKLTREVTMYQWKEHEKSESRNRVGGRQETTKTYTYNKGWYSGVIDSSRFKHPSGHENPDRAPFPSRGQTAKEVFVGAFRLSDSLIQQIGNAQHVSVDREHLARLPQALQDRLKISNGQFYLGHDPNNPQIGDTRIAFSVVNPAEVSLLSRQVGKSFAPWKPENSTSTIDELVMGAVSAESMFKQLEFSETLLRWGLRLAGFIVMGIGLMLTFAPLAVFADVIPFLGGLTRLGLGLIAMVLAGAMSLATMGAAWVFYRPLLGVVLLAGAGGFVLFCLFLVSKRKTAPA